MDSMTLIPYILLLKTLSSPVSSILSLLVRFVVLYVHLHYKVVKIIYDLNGWYSLFSSFCFPVFFPYGRIKLPLENIYNLQ